MTRGLVRVARALDVCNKIDQERVVAGMLYDLSKMNSVEHVFHLAIPSRDLEETIEFYELKLGCEVGRANDNRVVLNFFGHQISCHLAPDKIDTSPTTYPRHFGITFRNARDYDHFLSRVRDCAVPFFTRPCVRSEGTKVEHRAFLLADPSGNLLEFKHYTHPDFIY